MSAPLKSPVFWICLVMASAPTAGAAPAAPARLATEVCVWDFVQAHPLSDDALTDVDSQLAVGNLAVDACAAELLAWAEGSPAVLESGEPVDDVLLRMQLHYAARGALFAAGKARPFYEETPEQTEESAKRRAQPEPALLRSPKADR